MKYISYIALLGAATLQSAAAQDAAKGPACTAYKMTESAELAAFVAKIATGEI